MCYNTKDWETKKSSPACKLDLRGINPQTSKTQQSQTSSAEQS